MTAQSGTAVAGRVITTVLRPLSGAASVLMAMLLGAAVTLFVILVGVVLTSVYFRYGLNNSLVWGEELARYLVIWITFLGAPVVYRRREHIQVQILTGRLQGRSRLSAEILTSLVVLALSIYFARASLAIIEINLVRGQRTPALQWQIAYVQAAPLVGFAGIAVVAIEDALRLLARSLLRASGREEVSP